QALAKTIVWVVTLVTPSALVYEAYALVDDHVTISRFLRGLAERHHPVYFFAGLISTFLFLIALVGTHLPLFIRAAVLAWLFVFSHIFWGF
ncbi:MAG: hypothetical protein DMD99_16570, partial [Candidatus Rokuibacteriota bacterium]